MSTAETHTTPTISQPLTIPITLATVSTASGPTMTATPQSITPIQNADTILSLNMSGKFRLPEFDPSCMEIWFAASEAIFANHGIKEEPSKFSYLLQHLHVARLKNISSVITDRNETQRYTKAKIILLGLYAESAEKKFDQLVSDVTLQDDLKPSYLLEEIKRLSEGLSMGDEFLRRMWLKKIPATIRAHVAAHKHLPLASVVSIADTVHNVLLKDLDKPTVAAITPSLQPTIIQQDVMNNLVATVNALMNEVHAIKASFNDRSRSRDREDGGNRQSRSRSRSATPFCRRYYVKNELCTYHFKFGHNAQNCLDGCKHFQSFKKLGN